jgi:hypothetical protein
LSQESSSICFTFFKKTFKLPAQFFSRNNIIYFFFNYLIVTSREKQTKQFNDMASLLEISNANAEQKRRQQIDEEKEEERQFMATIPKIDLIYQKIFDDLSENKPEEFVDEAYNLLVTQGYSQYKSYLLVLDWSIKPSQSCRHRSIWNDRYKYIPTEIEDLVGSALWRIKRDYKAQIITNPKSKLCGAILVFKVKIGGSNRTYNPRLEIYITLEERQKSCNLI